MSSRPDLLRIEFKSNPNSLTTSVDTTLSVARCKPVSAFLWIDNIVNPDPAKHWMVVDRLPAVEIRAWKEPDDRTAISRLSARYPNLSDAFQNPELCRFGRYTINSDHASVEARYVPQSSRHDTYRP
jgi:hypothetical protein